MNSHVFSTSPVTRSASALLQPSPAAALRLLQRHDQEHGATLTALLDACHGSAAAERARDLAELSAQSCPDLAAACTTAAQLREDLLDIAGAADVGAQNKLRSLAPDTLDAAVRFHGARLDELVSALSPANVSRR